MSELYGLRARLFALCANMLQDTDKELWEARSCSEGDVLSAISFGQVFLRVNSIELGLKHIIKTKLGSSPPRTHDLVKLWEYLTEKWRRKIVEITGISEDDIRTTLEDHKQASVNVRFGGDFGATPARREMISKEAVILERLASAIGGHAHPPITMTRLSTENTATE